MRKLTLSFDNGPDPECTPILDGRLAGSHDGLICES